MIPHKDMSKYLTLNLRPFLYIHIWVSRSGPSALGIIPSPKTPVTTLQLYKFLCQFFTYSISICPPSCTGTPRRRSLGFVSSHLIPALTSGDHLGHGWATSEPTNYDN